MQHVTRGALEQPPYSARLWETAVRAVFSFIIFSLMAGSMPAIAHDVPGEARVHAFVKPEGDRLHVLVRIPLALLLNVDLPKQGPGYLALPQIDEGISRAIAGTDKDFAISEEGQRLSLARGYGRISLPADRSFDNFDSALALLRGPKLPDNTYVFWNQGYFDAHLEYPIRSSQSSFTVDFTIAAAMRDRLKVDLRYLSSGGAVRAYEFATASGPIALDPHWYEAARTFVKSGFHHIMDGPDHLLFLLCLIIPFRRVDWNLVGVVTSFTAGHSVTLIAAAYQLVPPGDWFPPLVELLIATSILYMAIENIVKPDLKRRWLISGLFGLIHGFGFSFMLQSQLQFAGSHLLLSLVAFNVGIELGQLLVLFVAMPALIVLYRSRFTAERVIAAIVCALIGHTAWHWMGERAEALRNADWSIPDGAFTNTTLMALSILLAGLFAWFFARRHGRAGRTL
jgi:hypothetical protein